MYSSSSHDYPICSVSWAPDGKWMYNAFGTVLTFEFKGELNAKTNLFLFESIAMVYRLTLWSFFLKLKSNYIEKLKIETKKTL